jgi:hypothetical protein
MDVNGLIFCDLFLNLGMLVWSELRDSNTSKIVLNFGREIPDRVGLKENIRLDREDVVP